MEFFYRNTTLHKDISNGYYNKGNRMRYEKSLGRDEAE